MYGGVNEELHARYRFGHWGKQKKYCFCRESNHCCPLRSPLFCSDRTNDGPCDSRVPWRGPAIIKRWRKRIKIASKWKSPRDYVQMINERHARVNPIWNRSHQRVYLRINKTGDRETRSNKCDYHYLCDVTQLWTLLVTKHYMIQCILWRRGYTANMDSFIH
jgi:hypothetical protein